MLVQKRGRLFGCNTQKTNFAGVTRSSKPAKTAWRRFFTEKSSGINTTVLKVTVSMTSSAAILDLEGRLAGLWVDELRECWLSVAASGSAVRVMLCAVTFIDDEGKRLLAEMHRQGVELVAEGCMNQAIVAEIEEQEA